MVERTAMSIINQMVHDQQEVGVDPILSAMPAKKNKQKIILLMLIFLLLISSLGLIYLIVSQDKGETETVITDLIVEEKAVTVVNDLIIEEKTVIVANEAIVEETAIVTNVNIKEEKVMAVTTPVISEIESEQVKAKAVQKKVAPKKVKSAQITTTVKKEVEKKAVETSLKDKTVENPSQQISDKAAEPLSDGHLQITTVELSDQQLATIYLKAAQKAEDEGDVELAVEKREQALAHVSTLNEVRKKLALYYYEMSFEEKAISLLRKGVLASPDYSDFNLMLSRIALKAGDPQRAYLYLNHNPPKVEGNLDYYVGFAILAQKFEKYEQSESLYKDLLSQRANNGRWRMSLAIAQDKQEKTDLAVANYEQALVQTDLSENAKKYINQRLAYLKK